MISDETREKWRIKLDTILEASDVDQIELNEWESDFFNSIYTKVFAENKDLSWKQSQALNKIYKRVG